MEIVRQSKQALAQNDRNFTPMDENGNRNNPNGPGGSYGGGGPYTQNYNNIKLNKVSSEVAYQTLQQQNDYERNKKNVKSNVVLQPLNHKLQPLPSGFNNNNIDDLIRNQINDNHPLFQANPPASIKKNQLEKLNYQPLGNNQFSLNVTGNNNVIDYSPSSMVLQTIQLENNKKQLAPLQGGFGVTKQQIINNGSNMGQSPPSKPQKAEQMQKRQSLVKGRAYLQSIGSSNNNTLQ